MDSSTILFGIAMQVVACTVVAVAFFGVARRFPRPWNRWWTASFIAAALGLAGAWAYYRTGEHPWIILYGPLVVGAGLALNLGLVEFIESPWSRRWLPPAAALALLVSAAAAAFLQPTPWFMALSILQTLILGAAGAVLVAAVRPRQGRGLAIAGVLLQIAGHLYYLSTNVSGLDPASFVPYGLVMDLAAELLIGIGLLLLSWDVGRHELMDRNERLQQLQEQLVQLSEVDPLTGAGTRHALRAWFDSWDGATPFSLFLVDIDDLQAISRRHGRDAGDEALQMVYNVLQQACTQSDLVVRWHDDQFLGVLRDTDDASSVRHLARLMRLLDDSLPGFPYATPLRINWGAAKCRDRAGIAKALTHAEHQLHAMKARRRAAAAES